MQKEVDPLRALRFILCCTRLPVLVLALGLLLPRYGYSQDLSARKITLLLKDVSIKEALAAVQQQSSFKFVYNQDINKYAAARVNISKKNIPVKEAIELVLKNTGLHYIQLEDQVVIEEKPVTAPRKKQQQTGRITGSIIDDENGEPVAGATIRIGDKGAITEANGSFSLPLTSGSYTAAISSIGYGTKEVSDIEIAGNQVFELSITLKRTKGNLAGVTIRSSAKKESVQSLLLTQKNNASMTDGISAEQIRATPDNNTAQVLKRVSGLTVQNDKFVTIRGVSDRYNNVLINGAFLPSTEPNRRNFSFDIIPSALVDNIVVNKTASPDLPAEFTGGLVQITSKDIPSKNFIQAVVGTGVNTASANRDFVSLKRDKNAFLGQVDAERKWFGDGRLFDQQTYLTHIRNNDAAAMRRTASQIPNRWQQYRYPYTPAQNYQLSGGINKPLSTGSSFGFVGAVTYLNEQLYEEGEARSLQNYDFAAKRYRFITAIGGLLNMALQLKNHKIAWKNLYNNRYSQQFDDRYGYQISNSATENRTGDLTLSNHMIQTRLEGEHTVTAAALKINWYGDYNTLTREQPDGRYLVATEEEAGAGNFRYNFNDRNLFWGGLYASVLKEKRYNSGISVDVPFTLLQGQQHFKTGYAWSNRSVDFDATGLRILSSSTSRYTEGRRGLPYYDITRPDKVTSGDIEYLPMYIRSGTTGDRYAGKQTLQAGYGMLDLRLLKRLRLTGGLRYEENKMSLSTIYYDNGFAVFRDSSYHEKDLLPSVNAIYSITHQFNIRGAFTKTLARPDFVERSPYIYYDFVEQAEVVGQYALEVSHIQNYDLRFEYYPSGNEIVSASLFYKYFDKPVERFYILGNPSNVVKYQNLYSATAKGFEIDVRKSLAFINPSVHWLSNLYVSGNYTYLKGAIKHLVTTSTVTGKDTSFIADGQRPIQGLSPFIINAGLNYQAERWGFNIAYNRFGRRIVNGGTNPTLIQYENPRDVIDLQLSVKVFKQKAELKCNLSDLLNQYIIIYCNNIKNDSSGGYAGESPNNDPKGDAYNEALDYVNYKAKKGSGFSVSFSYKL